MDLFEESRSYNLILEQGKGWLLQRNEADAVSLTLDCK